MVQHKPEKKNSTEEFIIDKFIYHQQDDHVEMHVDPVSGDLIITTSEQIIHVPAQPADVLMAKVRISLYEWQENSKRKSSFLRSFFL